MLSAERITKELNNLGITPPKIVFYEITDSTNTRAKEFAKENPKNRDTVVFIANGQSAGRGRRGRSFVSKGGAGIYLSILAYPDEKVRDATVATAKAAVLLSRAIEQLCDCKIGIKWVNDLYLGDKKLAGILTEGETREDGKMAYQVIGMGINVYKNSVSEEISHIATSLESEVVAPPDRAKLVAMIIKEFVSFGGNFYDEYRARSIVIGKTVTVLKPTESYDAKVIDINPDFSLIVDRKGIKERIFTGEISIKV